MPAKSNRKKNAAPAARTARQPAANRGGKNHRSPTPTALYVSVAPLTLAIAPDKPKSGKPLAPCADFDEAKDAAIEALIAAIEDAERKLAACKRATTVDELGG